MVNLFCTADPIGKSDHGGGRLAQHELQALHELGDDVDVINVPMQQDAFAGDRTAMASLPDKPYKIAHFYSQTYSGTIAKLKARGTKISYTCPAHDIQVSKEEHERLGLGFNFPHLQGEQWERYHRGYKQADVLIAQSTYSRGVLQEQGCAQRIEVIPPGVVFPGCVQAAPQFAVGFLGSCGPDKGVRYLIEAWDKLDYQDVTLVLAGRYAEHLLPLIRQAKGSYYLQGYIKDIADFYNLISLYVQPSCTESWGIEVTEAMAFGRPVICTSTCGAADAVESAVTGFVCQPRDVWALSQLIDGYKNDPGMVTRHGEAGRIKAQKYTWESTREALKAVWRSLC